MNSPNRGAGLAALASLPALPLCWLLALQGQPLSVPLGYLAYLLLVIAVPGTLLWRRLTGGTGWFAVDAVLGTAFGLALECLVYPVGRWLDVPLLTLLLPALAVGVPLAFPRDSSGGRPLPWWSMTGVMVSVGVVALWFGRYGSRMIPLDGPAALRPNSDSPFQLSLAAELTHHFPPQVPYVAGEPLTYHWMVYNHFASAHWLTGIELDVLVHRVVPLAFILLTVLGVGAVAVVLSGRAVAAPIGAGLTALAGDLSPWPWTVTSTLYHDSPLSMGQLISPTQAFSTVLMLPLIAATALLLRRTPDQTRGRVAGLLIVCAALIAVLSTTKATALPVYAAGVAAAWLYQLARRRLELRAVALGVMVAASYGANFFFVLQGAAHGMTVKPAGTFRTMLNGMLNGIDPALWKNTTLLAIVTLALLAGWLAPGVGALLIRRRIPGDPMAVLLVAGLIGAVAATAVLYQFSAAQVFLARSAFAYGVLIAAWGLSCLTGRQLLLAAGPALALGAAAIYVGRLQTSGRPGRCRDAACVQALFTEPLLIAFAVAAGGVVVLGILLRARPRTWAALAVAAAIGLTVAPTAETLGKLGRPPAWVPSIPAGGIEAARYIRGRSVPDDLIATNIHCRLPRQKVCQTASFWIPGYAERRVLVEGWAYTARANADGTQQSATSGPFWDQEKLRINDAAFEAPTRAGLETLRTRYGVRWLLADERVSTPPNQLGKLTPYRFRVGNVRVYELVAPPPSTPRTTEPQ